jgi:hypothetical protein
MRHGRSAIVSERSEGQPGARGAKFFSALRYEKPLVAYLDERAAIPELPDAVPLARDLDSLQAWVLEGAGPHRLTAVVVAIGGVWGA